jgi:hypothetical protein
LNSEIVRAAYGLEVLEALQDAPISCSGVTFGSYQAVLQYLRAMAEQLLTMRAEIGGIDQAAHNYLVRNGRLPDSQVVPNGKGAVLTLGGASSFELDDAGWVINPDGSVPTVVHQYDRHPSLEQVIRSRFAPQPVR